MPCIDPRQKEAKNIRPSIAESAKYPKQPNHVEFKSVWGWVHERHQHQHPKQGSIWRIWQEQETKHSAGEHHTSLSTCTDSYIVLLKVLINEVLTAPEEGFKVEETDVRM